MCYNRNDGPILVPEVRMPSTNRDIIKQCDIVPVKMPWSQVLSQSPIPEMTKKWDVGPALDLCLRTVRQGNYEVKKPAHEQAMQRLQEHQHTDQQTHALSRSSRAAGKLSIKKRVQDHGMRSRLVRRVTDSMHQLRCHAKRTLAVFLV